MVSDFRNAVLSSIPQQKTDDDIHQENINLIKQDADYLAEIIRKDILESAKSFESIGKKFTYDSALIYDIKNTAGGGSKMVTKTEILSETTFFRKEIHEWTMQPNDYAEIFHTQLKANLLKDNILISPWYIAAANDSEYNGVIVSKFTGCFYLTDVTVYNGPFDFDSLLHIRETYQAEPMFSPPHQRHWKYTYKNRIYEDKMGLYCCYIAVHYEP